MLYKEEKTTMAGEKKTFQEKLQVILVLHAFLYVSIYFQFNHIRFCF